MAWRFVQQPNGLLARFSEVCDDFTEYDMTDDEAVDLALDHMGRIDAQAKVSRARLDLDPRTMKLGDGLERFRKAIETVRFQHGDAVANERFAELSKQS